MLPGMNKDHDLVTILQELYTLVITHLVINKNGIN